MWVIDSEGWNGFMEPFYEHAFETSISTAPRFLAYRPYQVIWEFTRMTKITSGFIFMELELF